MIGESPVAHKRWRVAQREAVRLDWAPAARMSSDLAYGRKAVLELLTRDSGRVQRLTLANGVHGTVVRDLIGAARAAGIPVRYVPRRVLDRLARGGVHQGVVAETGVVGTIPLDELLASLDLAADPVLVACDGITDPRNLGAVARSAAAAGVRGLLVPTREAAPLSSTARKAAAGALDRIPVAKVPNLGRALAQCREAGFWVAGTAGDGETPLYEADLNRPLVIVLGREGKGLRPGVRKECDLVLAIPLADGVDSLNVSVAAGVVLFERVRQRPS